MQVTIRVTRILACGGTSYFEGTADSIEGAIKAADQLATGVIATTAVVKTEAGATTKGETSPKTDTAAKSADKPKADKTTGKSTAGNASPESGAGQQSTAPKDDAPAAVSYDQVKAAITDVASAKGRELTLALLARFGVASGKDLKAEQYADLVKKAAATLDGTYDPTASEEAEEADALS